MEINTKQFTTVIIGLVVAVVLVAGLMVPVISSLGSGGGEEASYTNTGSEYYTSEGEHTINVKVTSDDVADTNTITVLADGEKIFDKTAPQDLTPAQKYDVLGDPFVIAFTSSSILMLDWLHNGSFVVMDWRVYEDPNDPDNYGMTFHGQEYNITLSNKTATWVSNYQTHEMTNILGFRSLSGEYTYTESPYVDSATQFVAFGKSPDLLGDAAYDHYVAAGGTLSEFNVFPYDWALSNTLTFDTTDVGGDIVKINSLRYVSIQEAEPPPNNVYDDTILTKFFVPIEIGEGGGSDSNIPPTLMALISVIPLITVVGIVMGAIGYIRMRK